MSIRINSNSNMCSINPKAITSSAAFSIYNSLLLVLLVFDERCNDCKWIEGGSRGKEIENVMWWRHGGIKINNHYWKKEDKKKFNIIIIFYRSFTNAQANNKGLTIVKRMTQNKAERNSLPKKYPKKRSNKIYFIRCI